MTDYLDSLASTGGGGGADLQGQWLASYHKEQRSNFSLLFLPRNREEGSACKGSSSFFQCCISFGQVYHDLKHDFIKAAMGILMFIAI